MKRDLAMNQRAAGAPLLLILQLWNLSKMLCEKDQRELRPGESSLFDPKMLIYAVNRVESVIIPTSYFTKNDSTPLFPTKSVLQNYDFLFTTMNDRNQERGGRRPASFIMVPEQTCLKIIKKWLSSAKLPPN